MTTASNKNVKRRAACKKSKSDAQPSTISTAGSTSSLTTDRPKGIALSSQAFPNSAEPNNMEDHQLKKEQLVKTAPLNSMCCAQLELQIRIVKMNLNMEQVQREHWKRELDKCDVDLHHLAKIPGDWRYNSWEPFEQKKHADTYDQALVKAMLEAAHREVVKLENKLSSLESMLN